MFKLLVVIVLFSTSIQFHADAQAPSPTPDLTAAMKRAESLLSSNEMFEESTPIEAVKSSEHTQVPGTSFFIRVLKGFTLAPEFAGVRANKNPLAFVNLTQLPAPVAKTCAAFTAEALKPRGMQLLSTQTAIVNGETSYRFGISQNSAQGMLHKDIRCFGEQDRTYMITGAYPLDEAKEYADQITKIVSSVIVDGTLNVDFKDSLDHGYSLDGTRFKRVAPEMTGAVMFNTEGKIPSTSASIVYAQSMKVENVTDKMDFALKRLKQSPFAVKDIDSQHEITLAGLSGVVIEASGNSNKDHHPLNIFQQILFHESGYYIFMGTTAPSDANSIADFKKIAATFKLTKK